MAEAQHVPELVRRDRDQAERTAARLQRRRCSTPPAARRRRARGRRSRRRARVERRRIRIDARAAGTSTRWIVAPDAFQRAAAAARPTAAPARRRGRARSRAGHGGAGDHVRRRRLPARQQRAATASSAGHAARHRRYISTCSPARIASRSSGTTMLAVGADEGREQRRALRQRLGEAVDEAHLHDVEPTDGRRHVARRGRR